MFVSGLEHQIQYRRQRPQSAAGNRFGIDPPRDLGIGHTHIANLEHNCIYYPSAVTLRNPGSCKIAPLRAE